MKLMRLPGKKILLLAGVIVVVGALYLLVGHHQTVEIHRTETGFLPDRVLIHKGDTVRFINDSSHDIWPASNDHPSHAIYPEFDPKVGIVPGAHWDFTFDRAGLWGFHDHLYPSVLGTVVVTGAPGEARQNCLATSASTSLVCYQGDIVDTLEHSGLGAAFDLLKKWYTTDPSFQSKCHEVMHLLGVAAYKQYASDHSAVDRPEVSYCGYGFYHGFMEEMLVVDGPHQYAEARSYCATLRKGGPIDNLSGACYHGVGHALFDSLEGPDLGNDVLMTKDALDQCNEAFDETAELVQCGSGVFNALDIAYHDRTYGMSFSTKDPLHVCAAQQKMYQPDCYEFLGIGELTTLNLDRAASLRFIQNIPDAASRDKTLFGYMSNEVRVAIATIDLHSFSTLCESLPQESATACVDGTLAGLRESGVPGKEYAAMFQFCALLQNSPRRIACEASTLVNARPLASDKADFARVCREVKDAGVRARCN